jgi:hypothetical protein
MLAGAFLTAALLILACEPGSVSTSSPSHCTEVGSQCQLSNGPLGVCERSACSSGATPPCFSCTPQH